MQISTPMMQQKSSDEVDDSENALLKHWDPRISIDGTACDDSLLVFEIESNLSSKLLIRTDCALCLEKSLKRYTSRSWDWYESLDEWYSNGWNLSLVSDDDVLHQDVWKNPTASSATGLSGSCDLFETTPGNSSGWICYWCRNE